MNNIFEELLRYGFHDTKISSIDGEGLEIKLNFDNGIYFLNENRKETNLSNSIQIVLRLDSFFDSFEDAFEIKEYGKKLKYIEYSTLKRFLQKEEFGISMSYYSNFNNSILFDGGISKKNVMFSIEGINEIIVQELKKSK